MKRRAVETVWLHATPRVKPRLTTGTPWSAAPITLSLPGIVRWISCQRSEACHGKCVLLSTSARSPRAPSRPIAVGVGAERLRAEPAVERAWIRPPRRASGACGGRLGGDDLVEEVGRAGAQAELVGAAVDVERRDRPHPALPAAGRVREPVPAGAPQVGVVARGEPRDRGADVPRRPVRRAPADEPLDRAHVLDALVEEVGLEVAVIPAEPARPARVHGHHDVGHPAQLVLRVCIAMAEAERPVVVRLHVGPAAGRPPHFCSVLLLGGIRCRRRSQHGECRRGPQDSPPHRRNPMRFMTPLRPVQPRLEGCRA